MKNTKLTPAQAQALQAKADRKAEALLRAADPTLRADNKRIDEMYAMPVDNSNKIKRDADLAHIIYSLGELETIPDAEVRERCLKLAALWPIIEPNVPFPGVGCWEDLVAKDNRLNWYLDGENLKGDLPAMITNNGRLTQDRVKLKLPLGRLGYRYSTVTVRTALQRAMKGKAIFNY